MGDDRRRPTQLDELRRLTVRVVLALISFVVIGNFIDDIWLGNRYTTDPGLFTLTGGIIAGLFAVEALVTRLSGGNGKPRRNGGEDDSSD